MGGSSFSNEIFAGCRPYAFQERRILCEAVFIDSNGGRVGMKHHTCESSAPVYNDVAHDGWYCICVYREKYQLRV